MIMMSQVLDDHSEQIARMEAEFAKLDTLKTGKLGPDDVASSLKHAGMMPPQDKEGDEQGSAMRTLFNKYGDPASLFQRNGTPKPFEEARMEMKKLREFMISAFDKGSTWAMVLNQDTGMTGRVPLSHIHLFDPLPSKKSLVSFPSLDLLSIFATSTA